MIKMTTNKQREDYQKIRPKEKKFTKTDLAKYVNSANMLPYYVSWGSDVNSVRFQEQLEKKWDKDNSIYNEYYYKELIGMAILFKSLEKIISKQEWFIERRDFRPQLVTYTFSKFVYEASKIGYKVDYKKIWDNQSIDSVMEKELAAIAKLAFDNIYYAEREISNISTYCKNKICWERLQGKPYTLSDDIKRSLISNEERDVNMNRSRREQRDDTNIDYSIEIFNKGEEYWQILINKANEQRALGYIDIEFLEAAKKSCLTGRAVSNKQAQRIATIVNELKKVGIE